MAKTERVSKSSKLLRVPPHLGDSKDRVDRCPEPGKLIHNRVYIFHAILVVADGLSGGSVSVRGG